jgi:hypothetical protein
MPIHSMTDTASGAGKPKFANTATVFGVSVTEVANTSGDGRKVAHAGWNKQTLGTGYVKEFTINAGGDGFANDFVTFTGAATTNANARIFSIGGAIQRIDVLNPGAGYVVTPTVSLPTGANASVTVVMGGRANRKTYETLVAAGSISGDSPTDNTYFPGI